MRARRSSLRRRQGRRRGRPARAQAQRAREPQPPLHAGDDSVRRAPHGRDGAGHGHERAGDGLVHGHLFDVSGRDRAGDRHRQARRLGRHAGPARGDRSRRRLPRLSRAGQPRHCAGQRDCDHPGLRQRRLARCDGIGRARREGDRRQRPLGRLLRSQRLRCESACRSRREKRRARRLFKRGYDPTRAPCSSSPAMCSRHVRSSG